MTHTRMVLAICACLIAGAGIPASAQVTGSTARPPVNAEHEQLKTDADQAYQKGDYQKVLELAERVLRANSQDHVALYLRGSARIELGLAKGDKDLMRAGIADSREAIRLGGGENRNYYLPYLSGMTRLAAVENRKEHAEVADKVASDVLGRMPDAKPEERANFLYQRGLSRVYLKNYEGAVADFQQGVKLVPSHLGNTMGVADAYVAAGKLDQAETAFGQAIQAFRNNPLVYNNRGMFLQQQQKYDKAQEDFTRALDLDPNYQVAYINRGFTLMQSGQPAAAENDFTQALRINARQPMVYSMRATARLAQGKMQDAIRDQLKVVEFDPRNPIAQADLGFTRFFAQEYVAALDAFAQAVRMDSNIRYLAPWQYWSLVRSGQQDAARRQFAEALGKNAAQRDWPENLVALLAAQIDPETLLGTIFGAPGAAGGPDAATAQAQRCEAHFFIGLSQANIGNEQVAAEHFQKALQTKAMHLSAYRGSQIALDRMKVARGGAGARNR